MSVEPSGQTDVSAQLEQLTDLFRRRLLDDKVLRQALETQQAQLERMRSELSGDHLVPLLKALRLVVDRARDQDDAAGFGKSIAEEIIEGLASYGIDPIDECGPFDTTRHEVAESQGGQGTLIVDRIVSIGFSKGGRTLIPARVGVIGSAQG
ncbi:MAG TPA: nucleotide exchange factor GrpE [Arachnia sp.]|nr:nucleotide exchange factor GrpE [Arachnia sp.]HMT84846.1 nucleotide exchange factor GrpE [Arachnia sp.]